MKIFVAALSVFAVFLFIFGNNYYQHKIDDSLVQSEQKLIEKLPEPTLYEKLNTNETVRYLIVGDSIGEGSGVTNKKNSWANVLNTNLSTKYKNAVFSYNITKGGSATFDGIVEFSSSNFDEKFDLVIICFGQNDQSQMTETEFKNHYELLIRKIIGKYPNAEIATILESSLKEESYKKTILDLSSHYKLINFDTIQAFQSSGISYARLAPDGTHPNERGQKIYSKMIEKKLEQYTEDKKDIPIRTNINSIYIKNSDKYSIKTKINPNKVNGFVESNNYFLSKNKNDAIEYEFNGNKLGLTFKSNELSGKASVYIDNKFIKTIDTYSPWSEDRHYLIAEMLDFKKHTVKIINITSDKSKNNMLIKQLIY